jgi:hypothetical protein
MEENKDIVKADNKQKEIIIKIYNMLETDGIQPCDAFPLIISMISHLVAESLIIGNNKQDLEDILVDIKRSIKRLVTAYFEKMEEQHE